MSNKIQIKKNVLHIRHIFTKINPSEINDTHNDNMIEYAHRLTRCCTHSYSIQARYRPTI